MSNVSRQRQTAPVFAALGDVTRLELISRLSDGQSQSIVQLSDGLSLSRQGVTKHLAVLQNVGLVAAQRVGRECRYRIQPEPIADAQDYLAKASAQWDDAIVRLRAAVET
ncbi:MAG: metalloregulator ArsR/SmtB family transcription factor [Pseudomonadota bacterium]